jgi:hypothetical protein
MKNLFLLFLISTYFPFAVLAQFGLKGGTNLSYISGQTDIVTQKESKVAFQFGIVYKHLLENHQFAIQPELKFIRKGARFQIGDFKVDGQLDYIEIPLMGVFNFLDGALSFQAGPQFGFLTSVVYDYEKEGAPEESFEDNDLDHYHSFDLGLAVGVALNLDNFFIELRYNIGLLDIDKDIMVNGIPLEANAKNFNAELSIGHFF